jgi:L-aspartate oxidase
MEFMQFHPTVLYIAGSSRTLITEAVRGEGAYLVDCNGHRFMADYDDRMELAPRDIVSQSIVQQMEKTQHPCVYLTLEHLDSDHVRKRFPGIAKVCEGFALDIASDKIPVRPGAHYMLGGVVIDQDGRTSLPGLLAAGEVSSSGLHGANRLASNSLLEGLVYGVRAGRVASDEAFTMRDQFGPFPIEQVQMAHSKELFDASDVRNSLKSLMWRNVGVERSEQPLASALETIRGYSKYVLRQPFDSQEGWELQNLLTVSMLMTWAALTRRESRGVHLRTDFPELDAEHWQHHLDIQR